MILTDLFQRIFYCLEQCSAGKGGFVVLLARILLLKSLLLRIRDGSDPYVFFAGSASRIDYADPQHFKSFFCIEP